MAASSDLIEALISRISFSSSAQLFLCRFLSPNQRSAGVSNFVRHGSVLPSVYVDPPENPGR